MSFFRKLLAGWTHIAGRFGAVQTLVMLGLFYVVLLGPVAPCFCPPLRESPFPLLPPS